MTGRSYEAIVIGVSAGGMKALTVLLSAIPADYWLSVIIVQHINEDVETGFADYLNSRAALRVEVAIDKAPVENGVVYIAPAGYHLLVEEDRRFSLSVDPLVNYARPSINVLFESAAEVYGDNLIAVILTGANDDGSQGMEKIKALGGMTIAQEPYTAHAPVMPKAAIERVKIDHILPLEEIGPFLAKLCSK